MPTKIRFQDRDDGRKRTKPEPWPRRLLYVSTLTSYERQPGNKYNGIKEPSYNAISYTWGRFENKAETPINISGVTWSIPGIQRFHFTVDEFEKAIITVAEGHPFIWLDVACIDQEDETVKLAEINNQAAIFRRAQWVYAWLVPWTTDEMLRAFHCIEAYSISLGFDPEGTCKLVPSDLPVNDDLETLSAIFKDIEQQGWFTSLWTLQEAFLSRPYFISRSGESVHYRSFFQGNYHAIPRPVGMSWLAGHSRQLWDELRCDVNPHATSVCESITSSGILSMYYFGSPHLLYPAALKRWISLPQDTLYAIMHVFQLHLRYSPDGDRMLNNLALYLNQQNPLDYQIFVHQEHVNRANAWRMSRTTHLPFQFFSEGPWDFYCSIEASPRRRPLYTGLTTTLPRIVEQWKQIQERRGISQDMPYRPMVLLDATETATCLCLELEHDPPAPDDPALRRFYDKYSRRLPLKDVQKALPCPIESYRILLLGSRRYSPNVSAQTPVCLLRYHFGLLVQQEEVSKGKPWYRVGFCAWLVRSRKDPADPSTGEIGVEDPSPISYSDWKEETCLIG
jgi:hypothetical protein